MLELIFEGISYIAIGIGFFIAGFFVLIVLALIFGDRKLWEYEAEGYCEAGQNDKIKVEIKHLKRKGKYVRISGSFKTDYQNKDIMIFLNGFKLVRFDASINKNKRMFHEQPVDIEEPKSGDTLSIRIDDEEVFSHKIYKD